MDTKATDGYTAYGSNDNPQFIGIDTPGRPSREPYNPYRFNAERRDLNSNIRKISTLASGRPWARVPHGPVPAGDMSSMANPR
jgi:hypothetical protein